MSSNKEKARQSDYYERVLVMRRATPEAKEKRKAADAAYRATPKGKEKRKGYNAAYRSTPEAKARAKDRKATPEAKARAKDRKATPEAKARAKARETSPKYKARKKAYAIQRKYNLTPEELEAMIRVQDNRCACCRTMFGLIPDQRPQIDHCHATGRVRGILCSTCNTVLGKAADSPALLENLANYLRKRRKETAGQRVPR